jgi:D-3-phosphoglycerate dehydrogenase
MSSTEDVTARRGRGPKVLIYRPVDASGESHRMLGDAGCDVVVESIDMAPGRVPAAASDAAVLMGATYRGGIMTREFFEQFPSLRLVSKYTVGVDDIDIEAATRLGILVTHCPTEANCGGVAEGTFALMLALLKKIRERDRRVKQGGWRDDALQGIYIGARADGYPGITVGIIGLGRIGARLAELLAPWRACVLATDPYVDSVRFAELGVARVRLEELLERSDVVTVHCDLNDETRDLLDSRRLALMKPTAFLINTARGAIVDTNALCDALAAGRLGGAALDVFGREPVPGGAPILGLGDRVLLSPHMAAANQGGTLQAAIPWATEAALAAIRGCVPAHVYNDDATPLWIQRFGGHSLL